MEDLQQSTRVTENVIYQYNSGAQTDSLLMPGWMDKYYEERYSSASDKMNFPIEKLDTNMIELLSRGFGTKEKDIFMIQAYKTAGQAYRVIDDDSFGIIVPYKK